MKLSDLFVKLRLDSKQYESGLKGAEKKTGMFGKGIGKIGGLIAGAFAVSSIVNFGKELVMLGGQAEGVRTAFERIAPAGTMERLQAATKGTVSEIELMKRTVMASNFNIPVENLADLFAFATKRAQETGESVDYLVNSIVLGIGRKSPLILDNLGISAVDLRQKLEGVGHAGSTVGDVARAVGEIASEAMAKSGDIIETNAIKVANLTATWENFKLVVAESDEINKTFSTLLSGLTLLVQNLPKIASVFGKVGTKINEVLFPGLVSIIKYIKDIKKESEDLPDNWDDLDNSMRNTEAASQSANETEKKHIKTLNELRAETDELKKSQGLYNIEQGDEIRLITLQIEANEKLIKTLTTLQEKKHGTTAVPELMTGKKAEPITIDFDAETGLANMQSFYDKLGIQLKDFTRDYDLELMEFTESLVATMEAGFEDLIGVFAEGIGRLASGDIGFEEFGLVVLDTIGSFLGQMGKLLIAYGIGMEAFKKAFANPLAAIAAGIALVAIGGAVSGLASRGLSGGGGGGASGGASSASFNVITTNDQDQQLVAKVSGNDLNFVLSKYNTNMANV